MESRRTLSGGDRRLVHRLTAAAAIAALVAVVAAGLAAAGNPVHRLEHAWHSFKGGYGEGGGNRLLSGLGSNRYDFYRVALDEFRAHPLAGIGVDNYSSSSTCARASSEETPRYPHSVELRTLSQTGLIGALLALVGLGAALIAAPARRPRARPARRGRRRRRAGGLRLLGRSTARSTGSGSSPASARRPSPCSASPARSTPDGARR